MNLPYLFPEENVLWPEDNIIPLKKCPIRRLNFDNEGQSSSRKNSVSLKVNKVTNLRSCIPEKLISPQKSSPIQMFNSFLSNTRCTPEFPNSGERIMPNADEGLLAKPKTLNKRVCCNCKKSNCLKLYCECFSNKVYCRGCSCTNCFNTKEKEESRVKAMQATLERNPSAFEPKFAQVGDIVL